MISGNSSLNHHQQLMKAQTNLILLQFRLVTSWAIIRGSDQPLRKSIVSTEQYRPQQG